MPSSDVDEIALGTDNQDKYVQDLFARAGGKRQEYVALSNVPYQKEDEDVKLIAYYLPQFHPIPENDEWWGKGFTEWTNVSKAVPQFCGHYQPHLPDELGFYDLRLPEIQKRQIELAKQYGVYGFCYHFYWFSGKRLLERPLQQVLDNKELDFPFCICWANENWSRRWDGMDDALLMKQHYSPEDDNAFIQNIAPILQDERYIRIKNKPVLLVYRIGLLPEPKATAERWRTYCRDAGVGEIYLIAVQGLDFILPQECGFDAAAEFPPHTVVCANVTDKIKTVNPAFSGIIYDLQTYIKSKQYMKFVPYTLFKGVFPSWDNTARKIDKGTVYWGANPDSYKEWLSDAVRYTKNAYPVEEQIVFINAWNEWAEGAHLEPDRKYGYAYLQATMEAVVEGRKCAPSKKILCVSHDAHRNGAQILMLNMVKILKTQFKYDVHLMLKSGGKLEADFAAYATVYNLETEYASDEKLGELVRQLYIHDVRIAICNTTVCGDISKILAQGGMRVISLVHELPGVIKQYHIEGNASDLACFADKVVFPAVYVKEKFQTVTPLDDDKVVISPQGLVDKTLCLIDKSQAKIRLRERLHLPMDAKIVLGVGYADIRKGIDLFIEVAQKVIIKRKDVYFLWIGEHDAVLQDTITEAVAAVSCPQNVIFLPFQPQSVVWDIHAGADYYLLTSREDPFPSVVIDSMATGTPVIAFENAGGFVDIVTEDTGALVPFLDANKMAEKLLEWYDNPELVIALGHASRELIAKKYLFVDYMYGLLSLLGHTYKKVSAVVPSYNYGHYLQERLQNVAGQTYPLYEMIILDDCSTDNSKEIAQDFADDNKGFAQLHCNDSNSGNVFLQWSKGIERARGEYIWIAEADDIAEAGFLEEAIKGFEYDNVILSYTQSRQMDEQGQIMANDYLEYTNDIDTQKWCVNYVGNGNDEIMHALAVKNTIPNVSAVVFRKVSIGEIIDAMTVYKVAGDWVFYVWLLTQGNIAYRKKSLNNHRRHRESVTSSGKGELLFNEIVSMQDYMIKHYEIEAAVRQKIYTYRQEVKKILNC